MGLRTAFTELFGIQHPVVLAPMGGSAGGALVAAVSGGGGLGLLGAGPGDPAWLEREIAVVQARTDHPWGVGFWSWAADLAVVEQVLAHRPAAVMFSFGDPAPLLAPVRAAGVPVVLQVTDLDEARQAVDLGADVVVAQGTEAGGHGSRRGRSTLPFVPVVVDLVSPTPVLAAGGIADGRGLAAALALGAQGALLGTRFQATPEALVDPATSKAVLEGLGGDTERSRVLDLARGSSWPERYTGRTLAHPFLEQWRGREALAGEPSARRAYAAGVADGSLPPLPVWAGEGLDLVTALTPAADLVGALVAEAEAALQAAGRR